MSVKAADLLQTTLKKRGLRDPHMDTNKNLVMSISGRTLSNSPRIHDILPAGESDQRIPVDMTP